MINDCAVMSIVAFPLFGAWWLIGYYFERRGDRKRIEMLCHWYNKLGNPTSENEIIDGLVLIGFQGLSPFALDELLEYGRLVQGNASESEMVRALRPLWKAHSEETFAYYYLYKNSRYG